MKFKYVVHTDPEAELGEGTEIDFGEDVTTPPPAIQVRTPRGTTYAAWPENEGQTVEILLVEPKVVPVVEVTPQADEKKSERAEKASAKS
jgi:hypothetical protein